MIDEMQNELSIVVPADDADGTAAREVAQEPAEASRGEIQPSLARRVPHAPHRLTDDEQRELIRLYSETSTPTLEIRQRFGIPESSLYRIVQRHGVPLRGRPLSTFRGRSVVRKRRKIVAGTAVTAPDSTHRFRVELVIDAHDIREALRQAQSLGAGEVVAITRETEAGDRP